MQRGMSRATRSPAAPPSSPAFAANLPAFPANLRKQLKGVPMPAPRAIMSAAVEGSQVDFDNASTIESRYFVELATGQVAKNMIQAFFFDMQAINSGASRPKDVPKREIKKVGVLGAGMMGAGIAYVSARAGFEVVLKDVSLEAAERGKGYSEKIEAKALSRGKTTEEKSKALLDRIHPTADAADFAGVDFVIEQSSRAPSSSTRCSRRSRTSSSRTRCSDRTRRRCRSPVSRPASSAPEDFIGIHFFSPVDKMPLVEIIKGEKTSDEALARVFDYTLAIRKTPDRGQRQPRLLHLARDRHVRQRGHRDAR